MDHHRHRILIHSMKIPALELQIIGHVQLSTMMEINGYSKVQGDIYWVLDKAQMKV